MSSTFRPIALLLLALAALSSCKKSDNNGGDPAVNSSPLIPASTGWEKVGTVKYSYTTVGFANQNSMQPDDLQMLPGGDIAILYSENYALSGVKGRKYYKARCTPGSNDTAGTVHLDFGSGDDIRTGLYTNRLIPDNYEAISLKYQGQPYASLSVYYEANAGSTTPAGTHFINHDNYHPRVYANGDVLAGILNYSTIPEIDYFNRAGKSWTFFNSTTHDTVQPSDYTPLRLTDGSLVGYFIHYKGDKVYFSIADLNLPGSGGNYYHSRFMQELPEFTKDYLYTYRPTIIASQQEGNTFTVVVATYPYNSTTATALSAYKWTEGSSSFTPLYANVSITEDVFLNFKKEAFCTSAGTVYTWFSDGTKAHLITADAAGVHNLGETGNTQMYQIGAVRWCGNAFYGVAYPVTDQYETGHNLHMDIIRLKQ